MTIPTVAMFCMGCMAITQHIFHGMCGQSEQYMCLICHVIKTFRTK